MDILKDIIQLCHKRREKPLWQRKTVIAPALYKELPYHFNVYCAHRYPVKLCELEHADVSFMPIGRAPIYENGPTDCDGERFLKRQGIEDWEIRQWHGSCGIQVYTGTPSAKDTANWHDLNFTYNAVCAAPEAVSICIETLTNIVANPLLTITKSGGLRFSCRIPDYLHPNTEEAKRYIYKQTPTAKNAYQKEVYLEICGDKGYNRWDGRYELLLGNLLDPPVISKELLFRPIEALRDTLHQPVTFGENGSQPVIVNNPVVPTSLGSHNLDLAKLALIKRGFSYIKQENGSYNWKPPDSVADDEHVSLSERDGRVRIRASTSDLGIPMDDTLITEIWDDTGILTQPLTADLFLADNVRAVREGKLSPLAVKRPATALQKSRAAKKDYEPYENNAVQIQRVFDASTRVQALIAERGAGKRQGVGRYIRNGGAISLNAKFWATQEVKQKLKKSDAPSIAHYRSRRYFWNKVKNISVEKRMANPFQHGNVCEDPERCDALAQKGGVPSESICPTCPVYKECQQRGYLSQPAALQRATVQIAEQPQIFLNPLHSETVENLLGQDDETQRLCVCDNVKSHELFAECRLPKYILEAWSVRWQGYALGHFAKALLNAVKIEGDADGNAVRRIRATMHTFEKQADELMRQMCKINVRGTVSARESLDEATGEILARFRIEFDGGCSAYIPLNKKAKERLTAKGLPVFELDSFQVDETRNIPMSMAQAITLGILDVSTVESIQAFPDVCSDPNWTFWHRLQHFFAYYTRDADAPMLWYKNVLRFWVPPVLHPRVKRLLLMSWRTTERDVRQAFLGTDVDITHLKPTAWVTGNKVFQMRTDTDPCETLLEHYHNWNVIGVSKTGQRIFSGIRAEIERNPSVKHLIITYQPIVEQLKDISEIENVCVVSYFKELDRFASAFEEAHVIWIVGTPHSEPGTIWRRAQILYGNDEKPLSYEIDTEPYRYKDERLQHVYEQHVVGHLSEIVGLTGLNRLPGKTVVLVTNVPLPDITDRPETRLFDWEDFEVAGGLDKLPEAIAVRERFEIERTTLTADTSRTEVERILGCSPRQAHRVLNKLRGGNVPRVLFREQIFSLLANGERKASELVDAIEGHPTSVRNELTRLLDAGEIVKVRWGVYTLPSSQPHAQ